MKSLFAMLVLGLVFVSCEMSINGVDESEMVPFDAAEAGEAPVKIKTNNGGDGGGNGTE